MEKFLKEAVRKHQEDIRGRWKCFFLHRWGEWKQARFFWRGSENNIVGYLYNRKCLRCGIEGFKTIKVKKPP